jgi:hypothetical protein
MDFSDSQDHIDLRGFGVAFEFIGSAGFDGQAGELRATQAGRNTIVAVILMAIGWRISRSC